MPSLRSITACRCARIEAEGGDRADSEGEGYIQGFKLVDEKSPEAARAVAPRQVIRIFLKYGPHGEKVLIGRRAHQPARPPRVFPAATRCRPVLGGLGTSILTTSRGVMTGRAAKRRASAAKCSVTCGNALVEGLADL